MRIFFFMAIVLIGFGSRAQKFGYVDMQYILNRMPEYKQAQQEIEKLATGWEAEIQKMYVEAESMQASLKAEEILLTKEMYDERVRAIDKKWEAIKEYQTKIFGFDGLYFLKKKELIKPVQDKVFQAVEVVAKNNRLQVVFDKSGELVMVYTDPIHDYTDFVLEELGLEEKQSVKK
jgi:outer membrane protein